MVMIKTGKGKITHKMDVKEAEKDIIVNGKIVKKGSKVVQEKEIKHENKRAH